jgi:hypothetical protein
MDIDTLKAETEDLDYETKKFLSQYQQEQGEDINYFNIDYARKVTLNSMNELIQTDDGTDEIVLTVSRLSAVSTQLSDTTDILSEALTAAEATLAEDTGLTAEDVETVLTGLITDYNTYAAAVEGGLPLNAPNPMEFDMSLTETEDLGGISREDLDQHVEAVVNGEESPVQANSQAPVFTGQAEPTVAQETAAELAEGEEPVQRPGRRNRVATPSGPVGPTLPPQEPPVVGDVDVPSPYPPTDEPGPGTTPQVYQVEQ